MFRSYSVWCDTISKKIKKSYKLKVWVGLILCFPVLPDLKCAEGVDENTGKLNSDTHKASCSRPLCITCTTDPLNKNSIRPRQFPKLWCTSELWYQPYSPIKSWYRCLFSQSKQQEMNCWFPMWNPHQWLMTWFLSVIHSTDILWGI